VGPVTALAGVCLQDVERGAHEGGKRLLASRLRLISSIATHPPTYLPLHTPDTGAPQGCDVAPFPRLYSRRCPKLRPSSAETGPMGPEGRVF